MKTQKEAERAEQQRIKNLVLNYDLQDSGETDGTTNDLFLQPNPNLMHSEHPLGPKAHNANQGSLTDKQHQYNAPLQQSPHHSNTRSFDKPSNARSGQRARKLQLSDVDWYDKRGKAQTPDSTTSFHNGDKSRGGGRRTKLHT